MSNVKRPKNNFPSKFVNKLYNLEFNYLQVSIKQEKKYIVVLLNQEWKSYNIYKNSL